MGNTTPSSQQTSEIINKCWQPISSQLWRNKVTSEIIKQKRLVFQSQQEMKYVFACLVKRMNNYHPNVIKVFYLRKHFQKGSVCNCGEKHIIQVYVENVQSTLEKYITKNVNHRYQAGDKINNCNRKCVCMQIVKAAVYLKQRYGAFIVNNKNVWIQEQRAEHQHEDRYGQKGEASLQYKVKSSQGIKAKLWISTEEEQNFPDRSCQDREMCFSIAELIRNCLVSGGLCKCFHNMEALERLMHEGSVRELEEEMRKQKQVMDKNLLMKSNVISVEPKRTIRSYSSQDSSSQHHHFVPYLLNTQYRSYDPTHQPPERKYSSIEYLRKPIENKHLSMTINKKIQVVKNPTNIINEDQLLMKQGRVNDYSKTLGNRIDNYLAQENALTVRPQGSNQKARITRMYLDLNNDKESPLNLQHLRNIQPINSKTHYTRHANNFIINKPFIALADLTGNDISVITNQTTKEDEVRIERQSQLKIREQQVNEIINEKNDEQGAIEIDSLRSRNQTGEVFKIQLNSDINKIQYIEISQEKGADPTERTRIDLSLKEDEKKRQQQGVNTSRKNISTIPISLNSTFGAGSPLKPIIQSQDHLHNVSAQNKDFESEITEKKEQSNKEAKQNQESAQCSKSENNYLSQQQASSGISLEKEGQKSIAIKVGMSDSNIPSNINIKSDGTVSNNDMKIINIKQPSINEKQDSHSLLKKLNGIVQVLGNQQMGRMHQSEYITSAHHSLINSKQQGSQHQQGDESHILINYLPQHIQTNTQLTSLALMQNKFKTNVSIEDSHHMKKQLREKLRGDKTQRLSIRQCVSGEMHDHYFYSRLMVRNQQLHDGQQQQGLSKQGTMSLSRLEKLKQSSKSSLSNQQQSLKDYINEQSLNSSQKKSSLHSMKCQKQNFIKGKKPCILQVKKNENERSLIMRESEHPSSPYVKYPNQNQHQQEQERVDLHQHQYQNQQSFEYNIKINRQQQACFYGNSQSSLQSQQQQQQQQLSHPLLSQNILPQQQSMARKKLSLKQQFSQLFSFDNEEQSYYEREKTTNKEKVKKLDQKQGIITISIYNSSEQFQSQEVSKRNSPSKENPLRLAHPPINKNHNNISRYAKDKSTTKPITKNQSLQKLIKQQMQELISNNSSLAQPTTPPHILRMTSSRHEDNSIKQKVISKKAEFAQLKNQMNSLLF